jgi:uncharacterized protein with HEPN domain
MPRRVDHVLHDILQAIERVEGITSGKTLHEFEANWQLRWLELPKLKSAVEAIQKISTQ